MKQVVDFNNSEQVSNFIKAVKFHTYDQNTSFNIIGKKAAFLAFLLLSNVLKNYENVKNIKIKHF
jgi:hypothetical protein